ncbi:MAG: GNAT family N-acetyltransferase, partial [Clostridia bacterium]|nr:GNAT family N-acetyltransferase [Clostridia bacterium]
MENILTAVDGYKVAKIDESNIEQVFNLCKQNKQYYEYLQESPTLQNVKNILNELPPNTTINQKYFVGFYNKTELIAILDLIDSYPKNKSVFIGLFMVDTKYQGIGVGQHIIKTLLHNLKS